MSAETKNLTGYPSIDKPWLKYYSEEAINAPLPECTLYEYIYENNKDYTNNTALNYFGRKITYGKLFENIEKTVKAFQAIGIKKGDIVTIMSMHTPEIIYCIYALNRLGAVANMVYMTLSEQEIVATIKNTNSKAFVVLNVALDKVEKVYEELGVSNVIVISPSDSMNAVMKVGFQLKTRSAKLSDNYLSYKDFLKLGSGVAVIKEVVYEKDTPALIVYTSGSTGEPKGVVLTNDNLNAVAHQYKVSGMEFERGDTFFDMIPPYLGLGISVGMNLPLALGMEEILWILPEPTSIAKEYLLKRPNHFASAPIVAEEIIKRLSNDINLNFIKTFSVGGESPSIENVKALNEKLKQSGSKAKYITGYGMTETSATVCTQMNNVYKEESLGIPMIGINVKIIDTETGKERKYNEVGEMCFSAPNIMKQYYKNVEESNKIITIDSNGKRWIHTGDLGLVDKEGFLYHKGRIKRIYMTMNSTKGFYKFYPMHIEEVMMESAKVSNCATIGIPDEERINVAVSFITLKENVDNREELLDALMEHAKAELPEHSVPVKIIVLDELPMTQSGKVDYVTLEKMVNS